jgi:hypothetical protein
MTGPPVRLWSAFKGHVRSQEAAARLACNAPPVLRLSRWRLAAPAPIQFRRACPKLLRLTFHEWAQPTTIGCGTPVSSIIHPLRALAFKWQRILCQFALLLSSASLPFDGSDKIPCRSPESLTAAEDFGRWNQDQPSLRKGVVALQRRDSRENVRERMFPGSAGCWANVEEATQARPALA